uniref:ADAM metallopeptidase domain 32 n=1 Tax=Strigops habroptila TaxID=2489341 RepID=A0A672U8E6_STRHB
MAGAGAGAGAGVGGGGRCPAGRCGAPAPPLSPAPPAPNAVLPAGSVPGPSSSPSRGTPTPCGCGSSEWGTAGGPWLARCLLQGQHLCSVHRVFLPEDFQIYTDGQGGLTTPELRDCFYEGDIKGFPISLVALSTCSGLRGILQLSNASYGIKPLEAAARNQHLVYPVWNENTEAWLLAEKTSLGWPKEVTPEPEDAVAYDYMGADKDVVVAKIPWCLSASLQMFARLNLTIVLSSLEFWIEKNKIPTTGDAEELLQSFLQWKNEHRTDSGLFPSYREQSRYVGASSARKLCLKTHAGGVALYRRAMTLEAFAVTVAQLLGLSLGMELEDPGSCHCAGAACIMQPNSVHLPGVKAFSSCSIRDFQRFLATGEGQCLLDRPDMDIAYKAPTCGNKVVEPGEACDCGTAEVSCGHDPCCTIGCKLRRGVQCLSGPCCRKCRVSRKGAPCRRSSEDGECELKEYCNGTSAQCAPDLWVMDGHPCSRNTAFCYRGVCQTADKQCQKIFGSGKAAKNGPLACYEEINSQMDRMGHCGSNSRGYQRCAWKDLPCGKLVCEYSSSRPFTKEKAAVMYALVQNKLCVTLDYMKPPTERDPMLVNDGTVCGDRKVSDALMCSSSFGRRRTCRKCCSGNGIRTPRAVAFLTAPSRRSQDGCMGSVTPFRWVRR